MRILKAPNTCSLSNKAKYCVNIYKFYLHFLSFKNDIWFILPYRQIIPIIWFPMHMIKIIVSLLHAALVAQAYWSSCGDCCRGSGWMSWGCPGTDWFATATRLPSQSHIHHRFRVDIQAFRQHRLCAQAVASWWQRWAGNELPWRLGHEIDLAVSEVHCLFLAKALAHDRCVQLLGMKFEESGRISCYPYQLETYT